MLCWAANDPGFGPFASHAVFTGHRSADNDPLAHNLYRIPIQVSDSLEPIVLAQKADSTLSLLKNSVTFSPTTFRPSRYLQARWLLHVAENTSLTYNAVFRGVHVALLVMLVALFLLAIRVRDWTDLAAFSVAFPVLLGIHTFVAMLLEAFPVNHYAEVGVCALTVFVLAQRPPRWFVPVLACVLLALALSVIESGAMVWITGLLLRRRRECPGHQTLDGDRDHRDVRRVPWCFARYLASCRRASARMEAALARHSIEPRRLRSASARTLLGSCFTTSSAVLRRSCLSKTEPEVRNRQ